MLFGCEMHTLEHRPNRSSSNRNANDDKDDDDDDQAETGFARRQLALMIRADRYDASGRALAAPPAPTPEPPHSGSARKSPGEPAAHTFDVFVS